MTVRLRPVDVSDRARLREWRNRPGVARWMYTDHEISEDEHDAWFAGMIDDDRAMYWVIVTADEPVGVVHLSGISAGCAGWGIYVAEDSAHGLGVGTGAAFLSLDHAFRSIGLDRVTCEALADNQRAIGAYERVGFRREGLLRSHVQRGEERLDVVALGLLRSEWEMLRDRLRTQLVTRQVLPEEHDGH